LLSWLSRIARVEIGTGLFVLLGFAALGFLTTQLPGSGLQLAQAVATYNTVAKFDNIGGLKVGAPVDHGGCESRLGHLHYL
jgi:phospholipid/cholesterol/gamma-HCH transport system substrate-binding protein